MSNRITAYFRGRVGVTEALYQNDYGIVMNFDDIDLPAHFDCYFSTPGEDEAVPAIGADNMVQIPNAILARSGRAELHIPVHSGANDSEVEYIVHFKVIGRARPVDDGTPVQMTAIEQALALLQNPIGNIEQIVNEALAFTGDTFAEMQAQLDADQAAFKTEVRGDIADVESDFDNLNAQFQTAVSAVTVDSEVQNVRVGADNVTYASAGEAVRTQFTNLKSDLSEFGNITPFSVDNVGYITTAVSVGNTVNLTPNTNNVFRHTIIDVTPGEKITLNGTGWTSGRLWCFINDSNVVIAVSGQNVVANNLVLTVPTGATKCVINMYATGVSKKIGYNFFGVPTPKVDQSLTVAGDAADARVTGRRIGSIEVLANGVALTGVIDSNYFGTFENGDIQATTGGKRGPAYRIRTVVAKYVEVPLMVRVASGFRAIIIYYSAPEEVPENYISSNSWQTGEISINSGNYVGVVIARSTDDVSETANISEFTSKMTLAMYITNTPEYRRSKNNKNVLSVAHQGYSINGNYYGNSRISSYYGAYLMGFDYGETDIVFTSDSVPVCCHDPNFTDATTHETIVIADHTLAELKTYNYYGEKIASLDEVVSTCKQLGLGLFITHIDSSWSDAYFQSMFDIIDKYQMQDRVAWAADGTSINKIFTWNPTQTILLSASTKATATAFVNLANDISTAENKIIVWINYAAVTVDEIIAFNKQLNRNVELGVWTVDDVETYKTLMPFVHSITSNKIATNMVMDDVASGFKPN